MCARQAGRAPLTKPGVRYPKGFEQNELCGRDASGRIVEQQFAMAYGVMKARNSDEQRLEAKTYTGTATHSHQGVMSFSHAGKDTASNMAGMVGGEEELVKTFSHAGMDTRSHMGSNLVPREGCSK